MGNRQKTLTKWWRCGVVQVSDYITINDGWGDTEQHACMQLHYARNILTPHRHIIQIYVNNRRVTMPTDRMDQLSVLFTKAMDRIPKIESISHDIRPEPWWHRGT